MMLAKLAALGLLEIKVTWNKDYSVIISTHDVTNKILSRGSNYIVDVVIWPKFGNSNIFMTEVVITSILPQQPIFLRGALGSSSIIGTGTRYDLEILHKCGKKVETKSQNILESNPYIYRGYSRKTGRGLFARGSNIFKTFIKVRYTLLGKSCWGKVSPPSRDFVAFLLRKCFPQI